MKSFRKNSMEKKWLRNNIPHLELERRKTNEWYTKAKIKKCVQEGVAAHVLNAVDYTKTVRLPSKSTEIQLEWTEKMVKRKEMRQWIKINPSRVVIWKGREK